MTFYSALFLGLLASIIAFAGYVPGLSLLIVVALLIGLLLTFLLGVYAGQSIVVADKSAPAQPFRDSAASTAEEFRVKPHLVVPNRRPQNLVTSAGPRKIQLDNVRAVQ